MDHQLADQLGREMAWIQCCHAGLVDPDGDFVKTSGLLEGLIFAPLSAIAAFLSAPFGSKLHSLGMGALLGAGIGVLSDRETENRNEKGEPVKRKDLSPLMKSILTGLAVGGTERVRKDVSEGKPIGRLGAILTGAPMGALIAGSNPATGAAVGAISGGLLSALGQGGKLLGPLQIFGGQPQQQAQAPAAVPTAAVQPVSAKDQIASLLAGAGPKAGKPVQFSAASILGMMQSPQAQAPSQQGAMKLMDFGAVKAPTTVPILPTGAKASPPEAAKRLLS